MSSCPRRVKIFIRTAFFLLLGISSASAAEFSVSAGCLFDVAPFGLEQVYYTLQSEYLFSDNPAVGIKPLFAFNKESYLFRIPVVLKFDLYNSSADTFSLSGYFGCGPEYFRDVKHKTASLMVTGGVSLKSGILYADVPIVSAFRDYDTDSDLSVTAGAGWQW